MVCKNNYLLVKYPLCFLIITVVLCFCQNPNEDNRVRVYDDKSSVQTDLLHLVRDVPPYNNAGFIQVVVEISAGSTEKWEVDKTTGKLAWDSLNGFPRYIQYLGYPANYGMIPQTLLPKSKGGDGDPLDVLVLGLKAERGDIIAGRIIGVLQLLDRGEQDDKIIAVDPNGPFKDIKNLEDLDLSFPGVTSIIKTWFENYKGPGKMECLGYKNLNYAKSVLKVSIESYKTTL